MIHFVTCGFLFIGCLVYDLCFALTAPLTHSSKRRLHWACTVGLCDGVCVGWVGGFVFAFGLWFVLLRFDAASRRTAFLKLPPHSFESVFNNPRLQQCCRFDVGFWIYQFGLRLFRMFLLLFIFLMFLRL